jgi:hypothetical protein
MTATIDILLSGQVQNIRRMYLLESFPILGRRNFPEILKDASATLGSGDANEARLLAIMAQWVVTEQSWAALPAGDGLGADNEFLDSDQHVAFMRDQIAKQIRSMDRGYLEQLIALYDQLLFMNRNDATIERGRAEIQAILRDRGQ